MLLIDSNIFIYARGRHDNSPDCRRFLSRTDDHPDCLVPFLVILELTHYYADAGAYARRILDVFPTTDTTVGDFEWAIEHVTSHDQLNDHILLHSAHRLGSDGIVSYDSFFTGQSLFADIRQREPSELADEP